jgi:hypothetical protein
MKSKNDEIKYISSCVELFKKEKGVGGREAYHILRENNVEEYLLDNWEELHNAEPDYIMSRIDEYIGNNAGRGYRAGFMKGQINIPADYYRMGEKRIIKMFEAT